MKTIGFVDDAQYELMAFRQAFEDKYNIITSSTADDFILRLENQNQIDLLLFDLYFPIPGELVRATYTDQDRNSLVKSIHEQTAAFVDSEHPESDMAAADSIRRAAGSLMREVLTHYAQGPEGGLTLYQRVRERFPQAKTAFLSRKRTADDIAACLNAGALDVLQKPVPLDGSAPDPNDMTNWAIQGWRDHKESYIGRFENLMDQDVVLSLLTRLEVQLALYDWRKSAAIRKEIILAKESWATEGDVGRIQEAFNNIINSYKRDLPSTATWELTKLLVLLAPRIPELFS